MSDQPTFWQSLFRYQSAGLGDTPPWLNWLFWLMPRLLICSWMGHNRQEITDQKTGEFTCYCCTTCYECWGGSWDQ